MQQVHISRLGVNSIEFENDTVEIPLSPGEERSFELVMINYGAPTHVSLSVSDSLLENITVLEDNPYVRHEEYVPLIVRISYAGRLYTRGQVFVTVGYGSKKAGFNLNIGIPGPDETNFVVDVDESLSIPNKSPKMISSSGTSRRNEWGTHLPKISLQMLESTFEMASSKSLYLMSVFLMIVCATILAMIFISIDFGFFFGFYQAVFYSILLTSFMAFLLVKLPIFK
ncbi:DUF7524 family protein [Methanolobus halotolerans]|uniref:Uncharacterized protein n=1 Tax=Methanolobus halotolerans TaxID=2052935 RepID=A0A4E0QSU3_9EURY|nr:hypothetical protein [Methanolobus halotolerans]TGC10728.1 hypothetical protein CUN85_04475 [Methanolobus halotolerans]